MFTVLTSVYYKFLYIRTASILLIFHVFSMFSSLSHASELEWSSCLSFLSSWDYHVCQHPQSSVLFLPGSPQSHHLFYCCPSPMVPVSWHFVMYLMMSPPPPCTLRVSIILQLAVFSELNPCKTILFLGQRLWTLSVKNSMAVFLYPSWLACLCSEQFYCFCAKVATDKW